MMRFLLALALFAIAAPAGAQTVSAVNDLFQMLPNGVGDALLPPGHPEIARVQFGSRGPFATEFDRVYLFSVARPADSDFCVQQQFSIQITPVSLKIGAPYTAVARRIGETQENTLYRYRSSAGCDGTKPHFGVYLGPVEQGLDAVRALRATIGHDERPPEQRIIHAALAVRADLLRLSLLAMPRARNAGGTGCGDSHQHRDPAVVTVRSV